LILKNISPAAIDATAAAIDGSRASRHAAFSASQIVCFLAGYFDNIN